MTITTDGIVAACAGFLTISAVVGLLVRFVLVPYLRTHLIQPVAEVREQVKNTHSSNMREDIDKLGRQLTALGVSVDLGRREQEQWRREHMAYSASIATRLERLELNGN